MSVETRMIKFQALRDEINSEIEYWKNVESKKTTISIISEKLRSVDKQFFEPKIKSFTKSNDIYKPFLDKDRSNLLISEEIKFELRRYLNDLVSFDLVQNKSPENEDINEINSDGKLVVIQDEKLQELYFSIAREIDIFNEGVKKSSEFNRKILATSDLPPAAIEDMAQKWPEKFFSTAKDASLKIESSILKMEKDKKEWFTKKLNKMVIIIGVLLILLTILGLVAFSIL